MKKILCIFILSALLLGLAACGEAEPVLPRDGKPVIVTTLFPAYDFARVIGGERCAVTLLVPPGAESHSYEPTPQDVLRIENCDLLVANGGESEEWLETLLSGAEGDFSDELSEIGDDNFEEFAPVDISELES